MDIRLFIDIFTSFLRYLHLIKRRPVQFWQYTTHQGVKFNLRSGVADSIVIFENWWLNEYGHHLKTIPPSAIIIDIGAHIGTFSIFAATHCKNSQIYAFEPNPHNFALLKKNITDNKLEKQIHAYNLAVSSKNNSQIELISHPDNTGMNSAIFKNQGEKIASNTISLEAIFLKNKIRHCDFLKMDCEGGEYDILPNTSTKTFKKIKKIVLEYHPGGDIIKVATHLKESQFKIQYRQGIPLLSKLIPVPLLIATH